MKRLLSIIAFISLVSTVNAQWVQTSLNSVNVNCFAISGNNIFVGTQGGGVFLSSNNGSSWTAVNSGLTGKALYVYALAIKGDTLFAGTEGGGAFLSSNNGNSWTAVNTGLTGALDVNALAIKGDTIFAGTNGGMYLSSNNGSSWNSVNNGLPTNSSISAFAIKRDTIFAGVWGNPGCYGVFLSTNNGNSWNSVNTGLSDSNYSTDIFALAISGINIFAGTGDGIYLSTNNGNNWTSVNTGLPNYNNGGFPLDISGSNIFTSPEPSITGYGGGVYLSTNNGSSWQAFGLNDSTDVDPIAIVGNTVFAGTEGGGVWKRQLSEDCIKERNNNAGNIAVYPNPAINTLTIDVSATLNMPATIEITNIQGQLIETLATTGNKTNIDVSALAKGMYFVKVKTEKGVESRKFIKL